MLIQKTHFQRFMPLMTIEKKILNLGKGIIPLSIILLQLTACGPGTPQEQIAQTPEIFPDYKEVTVPCNIAPLNFMVEHASKIKADFYVNNQKLFSVSGKNTIDIPKKKWKEGLQSAKGKKITVSVSVWNEQHQKGVKYQDFQIFVSNDSITPWIAYRLIPPGYVLWDRMGIYQRDLESFEENCIVSNNENHQGCVNCHSFQNYSPNQFLFHARGKNGCTVLVKNGQPKRLELDQLPPNFKGTYPYWHPHGRFIAFANCDTHQAFYGQSKNKVEVYDLESDLMIYDCKENKVITDPRFTNKEYWETFPAFSPDGKYLYFCQAIARDMPREYKELKYAIIRVKFNEENGTLGNIVDTIYNPRTEQGSASFPRISPDGKNLLFTESDCGTFPIWHKQADLKMLSLSNHQYINTDVLNSNDVESYHSWDKTGEWVIFSSRRIDGRYTRLFITHYDEKNGFSKPFLLPQKSPEENTKRMYSYNIPEFILGEVVLKESVANLFE